jgi:hypothetical protein
MRQTLIAILTIFLCLTNLYAQSTKDEAELFFRSIVNSYFSNGDRLLSSFNDSVVIINTSGDTLIPASAINLAKDTVFFRNKLHNWTVGIRTYENYLNNYLIKVYDKKEFTGKTNEQLKQDSLLNKDVDMPLVFSTLHIFNKYYTDNDYLVVGSIPKYNSGKTIFGPYWMIVRKTQKGWKIFGIPN